jgi:hypothetical protein
VCTKLVRRLIADPPPADLVESAAAQFLTSNGDLRRATRTILLDGLPQMQPRFIRPGHFVVATLRQLHARLDHPGVLLPHLQRMGHPYFAWPTPDGYPDADEAWRHNLLPRWQFALRLALGELPGIKLPWEQLTALAAPSGIEGLADALATLLLGAPLDPETRSYLIGEIQAAGAREDAAVGQVMLAGLVAAPAFQWH